MSLLSLFKQVETEIVDDVQKEFNAAKLIATKAANKVEVLKKQLTDAIAKAKDAATQAEQKARAAAEKAKADVERLVAEAESHAKAAEYQASQVVPALVDGTTTNSQVSAPAAIVAPAQS
jgi:hypothetical protein